MKTKPRNARNTRMSPTLQTYKYTKHTKGSRKSRHHKSEIRNREVGHVRKYVGYIRCFQAEPTRQCSSVLLNRGRRYPTAASTAEIRIVRAVLYQRRERCAVRRIDAVEVAAHYTAADKELVVSPRMIAADVAAGSAR